MQQSHRQARRTAAFVAALPVASVLAVLPLVTSPALAATGNYSGSAALDLVHANVSLAPAPLTVVDAGIAPAESFVNSAGLTAPYAGKQSAAHATNVNSVLLDTSLPNLLVESTQTALPDNATAAHDQLLNVPLSPLVDATLADTTARARFTTEGCLPVGEPISTATTKVADAQLLPNAPGVGTLVGTVGLNNGAASTTSNVAIGTGTGLTHRSLVSSGATQVAQVSLLGGQVLIKVIGTPKLTATATGFAGTSTVTYTPAILEIQAGGGPILTLDPGNPLPNPISIPGAPLITVTIPAVQKTISGDGTSVDGLVSLVHVDVLSAAPFTPPLASIDVGKTHVHATVPKGGIDCSVVNEDNPLREAHKDVSAFSVNPGQTFNYTVAVPNRGNADITNVKVVDTVTPSGLVLVNATPSGTGSNPYTFNLGTIHANETKNIVLTFRVPAGTAIGTVYKNHAHITGDYKGTTYTRDADVSGPTVDKLVTGPCSLIDSNKAASHLKVVPGETFNWYVHVFNTGGTACTNVKVSDLLEPTVAFVSCTLGCSHVGNLVNWTVGTIAPGASATLTVTVRTVAKSGLLHNKAHITADGATPADPEVNGPLVTNVSVLAPAHPAKRSGREGLAFTGLSTGTTLLALLLLGMGLAVRRFSTTRRMNFRI